MIRVGSVVEFVERGLGLRLSSLERSVLQGLEAHRRHA